MTTRIKKEDVDDILDVSRSVSHHYKESTRLFPHIPPIGPRAMGFHNQRPLELLTQMFNQTQALRSEIGLCGSRAQDQNINPFYDSRRADPGGSKRRA